MVDPMQSVPIGDRGVFSKPILVEPGLFKNYLPTREFVFICFSFPFYSELFSLQFIRIGDAIEPESVCTQLQFAFRAKLLI